MKTPKQKMIVCDAIGVGGDTHGVEQIALKLLQDPQVFVKYKGPAESLAKLAAAGFPKDQLFPILSETNFQLRNLETIGIEKAGNPIHFFRLLKKVTSAFLNENFLDEHMEFLRGADLSISNTLTTKLDHETLRRLRMEGSNMDTKHAYVSTHPVVLEEKSGLIFPVLPLNWEIFWSKNKFVNLLTNKLAIKMERVLMKGSYKKLRKLSGSKSKIIVSGTPEEFKDNDTRVLLTYPKFFGDSSVDNIVEHVGYLYAENNNSLPEYILNNIEEARKNGKNIVFVSFGSLTPNTLKEKRKLLKMLADVQAMNTNIQIIFQDPTLKDNPNLAEQLREEILIAKNSKLLFCTEFLNYRALLPQMDAMISHFGIGSLQEAMRAGIRTLSLAFISEQIWTGNLAKMMGIALKPHYIKKMNVTKLDVQLRELLSNDELKQNAKNLSEKIKNEIENEGPGVDRAYAALMEILGEKV